MRSKNVEVIAVVPRSCSPEMGLVCDLADAASIGRVVTSIGAGLKEAQNPADELADAHRRSRL